MNLGMRFLGHVVSWTQLWIGQGAIRGGNSRVTKGSFDVISFKACAFYKLCCRKKTGGKL